LVLTVRSLGWSSSNARRLGLGGVIIGIELVFVFGWGIMSSERRTDSWYYWSLVERFEVLHVSHWPGLYRSVIVMLDGLFGCLWSGLGVAWWICVTKWSMLCFVWVLCSNWRSKTRGRVEEDEKQEGERAGRKDRREVRSAGTYVSIVATTDVQPQLVKDGRVGGVKMKWSFAKAATKISMREWRRDTNCSFRA
jgi:hypothetical protein